jgi:hypothetical protein
MSPSAAVSRVLKRIGAQPLACQHSGFDMKRYRSGGIYAQPGVPGWRTALAWLAFAVLWLQTGQAGAQGVNDGFDPAPNGSITALRLLCLATQD